MIIILDLDVDILKMYQYTKTKFVSQGIQKLNTNRTDRQTDKQTDVT